VYYLKFVRENGDENSVSCYGYSVQKNDNHRFVTAYMRDDRGISEISYSVGKVTDDMEGAYQRMYAMNINGQTLEKIAPTTDGSYL
jgi:hypothetical protein